MAPEAEETSKARDKRWQEEADVNSLSEAIAIQKDKKRLAAAVKRAEIMAKKQEGQVEDMRKIADLRRPMKK